ncbi:MAG: metallophosphoesterase [Fibrobacterota bacterium]
MSKILILLPALCFCLSIVQGPQVGNNGQNSFTVGWQTDSLSDSKLKWGLSPSSLTDSITSVEQRTWHVLIAENLAINTKYYYQVYSNAVASPVYFTKTAVSKDTPFRFGLITDTHGAYYFRQSYEGTRGNCQVLLNDSANLWFNTGDVVDYDNSTDLDSMFRKTLLYKRNMDSIEHYVPIYEVIGNHDIAPLAYPANISAPIWANTDSSVYSFMLPEDNIYPDGFKGKFYSFDYGVVHFQAITYNTYSGYANDQTTIDTLLMQWMAQDLKSAKERGQLHNIVLCHWGIFDLMTTPSSNQPHWQPGYWANQRSTFYHVLDTGDVELYWHGHHHYAARMKVCPQTYNGFETLWNTENFKNSIWDVTVGVIGGTKGSSDTSLWHMQYYNTGCDPYVRCDVDFRQITMRTIDINWVSGNTYNNTVIDSFKLRPGIHGNLNAQVASDEVSLTWDKVENGISLNGVGGYNIYRSDVSYDSVRNTTQSDYVKIGSVNSADSLCFTDPEPNLFDGPKYYVVCAYDTNYGKRQGNYSNEVCVTNGTGVKSHAQARRMQWEIAPNPFHAVATVTVRPLQENKPAHLRIFAVDGRLVQHFQSSPETGRIVQFRWNGHDSRGNTVPSGIYLARLTIDGSNSYKLLLLTR